MATTSTLQRPEGRIAYEDHGEGPLVVLVPGMGDTRATWRDVLPDLVSAGHRVVATDLRGHGGSDTTFTRHGDDATGEDLLALVEHLDAGPAVLVGNSMGASSAVWAAATRPDLVAGLVLVSPFLADAGGAVAGALTRAASRVLFAPPWGPRAWGRYYAGPLSKGRHAPWLAAHVADLTAALHRPGGLRSFRDLVVQLRHSVVDAVADSVTAPAVVVVGELDPDYRDPRAAAGAMAERLGARAVLVPEVAHYAQHQAPEAVLEAALTLLGAIARDGDRWAVAGA